MPPADWTKSNYPTARQLLAGLVLAGPALADLVLADLALAGPALTGLALTDLALDDLALDDLALTGPLGKSAPYGAYCWSVGLLLGLRRALSKV